MSTSTKEGVAPVKAKDHDPDYWHMVCICQRGKDVQFSVCGTRMKGIFPTKKINPEEFCAMCASVVRCPFCKMPKRFKGQ